ncbi:MurT ligase domain-containing protein [Agreia sp. PsM10]|uniref:MurT ligase domain-containing protein n=1 Tax=Agreia sp. PsM10 TaxID=3030533 RepID=UPI00263B9724|nr:MurT ligase domain-containing protein [Agreia sp. PsM10]MDN4639733.1 MurT ligase domain-containing protein [Agreia sp. PsM10]
MRYIAPVLVGRAVRAVTRARGGGSALPGYVVNKMAPGFIKNVVAQFEYGIVFVLGSNGKSTTTHMLTEVLRAHGLTVFTNPSGANLPQGISSALLSEVGVTGKLKADIGILEVDEAFALELSKTLLPSTILMLNVQVDQLYRFFETEVVADMMLDTAAVATSHVISNRDDAYLSKIGEILDAKGAQVPDVTYFGASPKLVASSAHGLFNAANHREKASGATLDALAELESWDSTGARIRVDGALADISLPAKGLHYGVDAAAALATAAKVLGADFDLAKASAAFSAMTPAYGRGELLDFGDEKVEFVMFKNAASLQLNLDALPAAPEQVMVAIDEGTPDVSWLYDIDFAQLDHVDVLTGAKAWQFALRLEHEGIPVGTIEPDLKKAIELMRALPAPQTGHKTWVVNYEQMMLARKIIGYGDMEVSF